MTGDTKMRVAVSGASGLIGTALTAALSQRGHEVLRLVRRPASGPAEIAWDPPGRAVEADKLEGLDAVVHLGGTSIAAARWTGRAQGGIRRSRVSGTGRCRGARGDAGQAEGVPVRFRVRLLRRPRHRTRRRNSPTGHGFPGRRLPARGKPQRARRRRRHPHRGPPFRRRALVTRGSARQDALAVLAGLGRSRSDPASRASRGSASTTSWERSFTS
jgi:hypothetical protein